MKVDILVIGSGLAGLVFAQQLAASGKTVLVVEKREHIGGNLYDYFNSDGILIHKYGPHIFRTSKKHVWDYLSQFTKWNYYQHKVCANVKGFELPFPINLDTWNILFNESLSQMEFEEKLKLFHFTDQPKNSEEAIINQVGKELYETFFKNYTLKQWGKHPAELHPDTVKRVPVRTDRETRYFFDPYQGLPLQGYTKMMEAMISHPNIRILLKTDFHQIRSEIDFSVLVYTGLLDEYFSYEYGELEYRSLYFEEKTFDFPCYQSHSVVNFPNNYDFTRITEYKKLTGQIHHKTTVHFEYPKKFLKSLNEPYYPILDGDNLRKRELYLQKTLSEKNTIFVGRLAEYRYYAMDEIIETSLERVSLLKEKLL